MKKTLMLTSALVLLAGGPGFAQGLADRIAADFRANGFQKIEIRSRADQLKAEGIRDGRKYEATYDKATGGIVKQEWESVGTSRSETETASLDDSAATDYRRQENRVDDSGDDENDDHGGERRGDDDHGDHAGDDSGTEGHASNDSSSHDSGRDNGGSHDSGRDNGGSDDNGSHDSGSHDSGSDDNGGGHGGGHDSGDDSDGR